MGWLTGTSQETLYPGTKSNQVDPLDDNCENPFD